MGSGTQSPFRHTWQLPAFAERPSAMGQNPVAVLLPLTSFLMGSAEEEVLLGLSTHHVSVPVLVFTQSCFIGFLGL